MVIQFNQHPTSLYIFLFILQSLSKEKERRDMNLNSFWTFSLKTSKWSCIYKSDHSNEQCYTKMQNTCSEPCPRYAHQLVYDWINKVHYLFGGNPGRNTTPHMRLDDFWLLHLRKPSRQQILRQAKYMIRRLEYEEIVKTNSIRAVGYLQTRLSDIIDHQDPEQLQEFHKLASLLFKCYDATPLPVPEPRSPDASCSEPSSTSSTLSSPSTSSISPCAGSSTNLADWNTDHRYQTYTPPPPTICCYGANTLKKDAELFTNKTEEQQCEVRKERCTLYNKLIELMPDHMVQPKGNLSDFIQI